MKVLILGSELWPKNVGGLGVWLYEVAKELAKRNEVTIMLPQINWSGKLPNNVKVVEVPFKVALGVYEVKELHYIKDWEHYEHVFAFNNMLYQLAPRDFDVIHAHDWMTFIAGILLKRATGKPLIVHVHSTEYDRTNFKPREWVLMIEKLGMLEADAVVTTSKYMKKLIVKKYGIPPEKIKVVYNAVDARKFMKRLHLKKPGKVVLFVGRLTIQKGVWHLLQAARKVLDVMPDVKFVIVGTGPDLPHLIHTAIDLGIAENVIFAGRVSDEELIAAYSIADVFVMPSVSEPFGIVALEAMAAGKPVIISKTSGVSEIVRHAFKVDFWDIDLMASRILELLAYPELAKEMAENGKKEAMQRSWADVAREVEEVYRECLR